MNTHRALSRISLSLALLTLAALPALGVPPSANANLLTNPGFEDGGGSYTGWTTFGAGVPPTNVQISTAAGDNIIRTGVAAAKVYGAFNNCPGTGSFNVSGFYQPFTSPTPGNIYQLSGYSYVSAADTIPGTDTCTKNRMIAKLSFFNATSGGLEIAANELVIGDGNSPRNQWMPFTLKAPVPSAALRVEVLILYLQPACDGGAVYVDDLDLVVSTPAAVTNLLTNPNFTSGLTGWATFGNVFTDTRSFIVRTPPAAGKLYGPFSTPGSTSGMYQKFAAAPTQNYLLSVNTLTTCRDVPTITGSNDNYMTAKIVFHGGGVEIASKEAVILDRFSPLGTWTERTLSAISPLGTDSVFVYILFVQPTTLGGAAWVDDLTFQNLGLTAADDFTPVATFNLRRVAPNPFSPSTRIEFALPRRGPVDIAVYDVSGRRVATLLHGEVDAGIHDVAWNGKNSQGASVAAGVYWCVIKTPEGQKSRSLVLMK